ncbi:MAG: hypothetical protein A2293_06075 [Elusimicrobia bacterium RIFOXYB2_FULL_49_7]|nr:MAG: hypothetical protein A2293_06075 [Elusimicrobia bacterium RIFOXYB2_FULL_49_7]
MTIHNLAKASGISYAVISKLERNRTNPALGTLMQLAKALGTTATELVAMAENHTNETKHEERYTTHGFLFRKVSYNNVDILSGQAKKGSRLSRPEVHENDTEIVFVTEGKIRLSLAIGDRVLSTGDSIQFDALFAHTYEALSDCEIMIIHVRKGKRF